MSMQELSNWYNQSSTRADSIIFAAGLLADASGFFIIKGPPLISVFNARQQRLNANPDKSPPGPDSSSGYSYISNFDDHDEHIRETYNHINLINNYRLYILRDALDNKMVMPDIISRIWSGNNDTLTEKSVEYMCRSPYAILYFNAPKPVNLAAYALIFTLAGIEHRSTIATRLVFDALSSNTSTPVCIRAITMAAPFITANMVTTPVKYTTRTLLRAVTPVWKCVSMITPLIIHVVKCGIGHVIVSLDSEVVNKRLRN